MAKKLSNVHGGRMAPKDQYTAGEIAWLLGVAHRTACKFIDEGTISGFRLPSPKGGAIRERRVHHQSLVNFIERHADYAYVSKKLDLALAGTPPTGKKRGPKPKPKSGRLRKKHPRLENRLAGFAGTADAELVGVGAGGEGQGHPVAESEPAGRPAPVYHSGPGADKA